MPILDVELGRRLGGGRTHALLLMGAVPLCGWLASRVPRRRLINGVTLFFVACLLLFYVLAQRHVPLDVHQVQYSSGRYFRGSDA